MDLILRKEAINGIIEEISLEEVLMLMLESITRSKEEV